MTATKPVRVEVGNTGRCVRFEPHREGERVVFESEELGILVPAHEEWDGYRDEGYCLIRPNQLEPGDRYAGTIDDARWMIAEEIRERLIARGEIATPEYDPRQTAIHEAGHAVASVKLRRGLRRATIIPSGDYWGLVTSDPLLRKKRVWPPPPIERVARTIIVLLAGYAAEVRGVGRDAAHFDLADSDYQQAFALAEQYFPDCNRVNDYISELSARTEHFVEDNWQPIETVADALVKHRELSRQAIVDLINQAGSHT